MNGLKRATVITVSDSGAAGNRDDASGRAVAERLEALGFVVAREIVPDERTEIADAIRRAAAASVLVLTTGGTGLGPRDVTPEATRDVLEAEAPGFGELMRAEGSRHTPLAYLSRGIAGVLTRALVVNLPGSTKGATESLEAIEPLLDHALETMEGPFEHAGQA